MNRVIFRGLSWRLTWLIASETGLILVAIMLAAYIRLGDGALEFLGEGFHRALIIAGVTMLCLYFADLYDPRVIAERRELFVRAVQALGGTALILAALYFWFPELIVGRGVFAVSAVLVIALVLGWRIVFEWANRRVGPRERLLLVGTNDSAVRLARELHERRDLAIEVVGFVDADPARVGLPLFNPGVIGTIDDIPAIVRARAVDHVVVSLLDARGKLPMDKLLEMKLDGVSFDHLTSIYEQYTGKIAVDNLRPSWLIFSAGFRKTQLQRFIKRALDIAVAAVGLIVLTPVIALIAVLIKLTSKGPVFYHQQRVGQHGRVFVLHKFRSMQHDAEKDTGAVWARSGDQRVTRLGRLLRKTRLDEVPQLWNVLRGHMSVVGPRPERPEFVSSLKRDIPFYGQRHVVRPGLTGWAQVRYTYAASVEDTMEKLQYDLFYIKHMSVSLDLFIMAKTVKTVLMGRGAH
jgi:sugar transferase (PEP-CTERM system associated)